MARIRTLKTEFWDSPSTAQADLAVRLTFMAMWNWADDSGHGTANVKELEAFVFPNDEVTELPRRGSRNSGAVWPNFAAILHEVAEVYGVVFYKVKGRPYYRIPSFNEHQAKHYRKESRYPQPEEGEIIDVTSGYAISSTGQAEAQDPVNVGGSRNSGASSRDSGIGTGEQGNRGTGYIPASADADADVSPSIEEQFQQWYAKYPRKKDRGHAIKAFKTAIKKTDLDTLMAGLDRYLAQIEQERTEPKHIAYPATWLNGERWDDETPPSDPERPKHPDAPDNRTVFEMTEEEFAERERIHRERIQAKRDAMASGGSRR